MTGGLSRPPAATFELSNGHDRQPIIHTLTSASINNYQYVVVDQTTKRALVINPARDDCEDNLTMSTQAADSIVALVMEQGYLVQHIFETHSMPSGYRSAAWYLRMQLAELQGYTPEISSDATMAAMKTMWKRRHGAESEISSDFSTELPDGGSIMIGRMRIQCLHLSCFQTPSIRALLIGGHLFGAHPLATLSKETHLVGMDSSTTADTIAAVWRSMQRVLSLPETTKVYIDKDYGAPRSVPCDNAAICRRTNEYADLTENEFCTRWEGQLREGEQSAGKPFKVPQQRSKFMGLFRSGKLSIKSR